MNTTLPPPVQEGVQGALTRLGHKPDIRRVASVAGGCINHGVRLETGDGGVFFLKWNASAPPRLFDLEADGLRALGAAQALRVPTPLAAGGGSSTPAWFLMEWIDSGPAAPDYEVRLGRGLARVHASAAEDTFGWSRSNWIGSLPQSNRKGTSWSAFWRDQRLAPQFKRARDRGHFDAAGRTLMEQVLDRVSQALEDVDAGPISLLHGDLWGGNAYAAHDGVPVIVDPAVYRGHGEVDLAMTELFGGFGTAFYEAYAEERGITPQYREYRRELYQLYYLLVHVNLFGAQYERRALAAARKVRAAWGP